MPRIDIDRERCKGCGLCVEFCPRDCIMEGEGINRQGYHYADFVKPDDCTGCAICGQTCPDVAIVVWR